MKTERASMFCPLCGADSSNTYCKRCGHWLPDMKARTRIAFGGETPQQNVFTGLFMSALSAFAALFSAISLYATYLGSGDAKWSVYVAAGICLCIAGWQASSFIVGLKLRQKLNKGRESLPLTLEPGQDPSTAALNPADVSSFVATPSVTENTTALLSSVRSHNRVTQR